MKTFHKNSNQIKKNGFREERNPFNEKNPLIVKNIKTTRELFYRRLAMLFALALAIVFLSPTCGKKQPLNQGKYSKPHIIINRNSPEPAKSFPPKPPRSYKETTKEDSEKSKYNSEELNLRIGPPSPLPSRRGL